MDLTGGNYTPCSLDKSSYQWLVTGNGEVLKCKDVGKASSVGGMNSITENISICAGRVPVKAVQFEKMCKHTSDRLKALNLTVERVYTHYEIGLMCKSGEIKKLLSWNNYLKQNIGKIDLTKLPYPIEAKNTGDFIRNKIYWYYKKSL